MFNRVSSKACRNATDHAPPSYNRGPWELRRNAISAPPHLISVPPQGRRNANQCSRQWEGSITSRSNARLSAPFPTLQQGVVNSPQKCLRRCTPTLQQGAITQTQRCHKADAPTLFGADQNPQRCHRTGAPTTRGHSSYAEKSFCLRLA